MEPFEYVVVLTSLILGLGIAQILTGVADIFSNIKNVNISYSHTLLVLVVFTLLIQEWWYSYQYAHQVSVWTIRIVCFTLIYPISLFVLARMIFPTGLRSHETDLDAYYYEQWPWFFIIFLLAPISSIFINSYISQLPWTSQIPHGILALIILAFLIFRINQRWAHIGFLCFQLLIWIFYFVTDKMTL